MAIEWKRELKVWAIFVDEELWREVDASLFGKHPERLFSDKRPFFEQFLEVEVKIAYAFAVNLLAKQALSKGKLDEKLQNRLISQEARHLVIERLQGMGYLDDASVAKQLILREKGRLKGARAIKQKLFAQKFDKESIAIWMEEEDASDEGAQIRQLLAGRFAKMNLADFKERQKLIRRLLSRGFSLEEVQKEVQKEVRQRVEYADDFSNDNFPNDDF